ncbi:electron transfer flavoprotein subunit alpha [Endomicrobiia bacterium]|nr:electron transfer flavoprotein subunit alpha [Endomicrobiia bacterium]GHT13341.1 electron transfer flavoprotein subunit alpha [Endomicrobiia bacterium]GHT18819.1 electron transfer flavoprotein subunit alpha [Endomicrobiia bacterium]GHT28303.1 electron transfer flavoprotein subunit alpha [Endomicrobiia bacterium]GHT29941.1 electron transfer flavoprotein subunit alpha [Endomicrobiia bacterium]
MVNSIKVFTDKCVGCKMCEIVCPFNAISIVERLEYPKKFKLAVIDLNKCTYCGSCVQTCKFNAIELKKDVPLSVVDKNLYKGVWVYAEQRHGEVSGIVYELLNEGKRLAEKLGTALSAVLIGSNIKSKARELIDRGVDKVYVCEDPIFIEFQDDPYSDALTQLIEKEKPEIILMGATNIGRSFAPRVAARIRTGLTADCVFLEVDPETRNLRQTRPAFGGNIMATILTPVHRPQMSTVRHKVFKEAKIEEGRKGEIIEYKTDVQTLLNRTKFLGFIKDTSVAVNFAAADIIVSGGRGLGNREGFKLIKELAELLGAAIGASRAAVDLDWIPSSHQIGQTGKTVAPKVYIACGISGQIQHRVGMGSSDIIIAINKDAACPMMKVATYALEGDLHEIIPCIIKEIKSSRCS